MSWYLTDSISSLHTKVHSFLSRGKRKKEIADVCMQVTVPEVM